MCTRSLLRLSFLLFALAAVLVLPGTATAQGFGTDRGIALGEKRVALVIGNADYATAPLKNPVNDARLMAQTLREMGFDVIQRENLDQKDMKRVVHEFGERIRNGGVALFYYAGHGMQVRGVNYMLPVGARIESELDVDLEGVRVDRVLAQMERANNRMNIVMLDACRNNPFARSFRSYSRGLAFMSAPSGTLIAYATAPGDVASDGPGRNGLYTESFVKAVKERGLKIEDVFKRVRAAVKDRSGGQQVPWESVSITGDFYFNPGDRVASLGGGTPAPSRLDKETVLWNAVKDSDDPAMLRAYLASYPDGVFAPLAHQLIARLERPAPRPPERPSAGTETWSLSREVLLADDFAYNRHGWDVYPDGKYYDAVFTGGRYVMDSRSDKCPISFITPPGVSLPSDYDVELDVTWESGVDDNAAGLSLAGEGSDYVSFGLSSNGSTSVWLNLDDQPQPDIMPWRAAPEAIRSGRATNRIRAEVRGRTIRFYINDHFIHRFEDPLPAGISRVGVRVCGQQRVAFDNLTLRRAPGGLFDTVAGAPSGGLLLRDDFGADHLAWPVYEGGQFYDAGFEAGRYFIATKNERCSMELITPPRALPSRWTVEVDASWRRGVDNNAYGLVIGNDREDYITFGLSGNRQAVIWLNLGDKAAPDVMSWKVMTGTIRADSPNLIRVEVRGRQMAYYVNGALVHRFTDPLPPGDRKLGFRVCGQQRADFDNLVVSAD
jgi:hypothetical protein